jgi:hypothetical protein
MLPAGKLRAAMALPRTRLPDKATDCWQEKTTKTILLKSEANSIHTYFRIFAGGVYFL